MWDPCLDEGTTPTKKGSNKIPKKKKRKKRSKRK